MAATSGPRNGKRPDSLRAGIEQRARELVAGSAGRDHVIDNDRASTSNGFVHPERILEVSPALDGIQAGLRLSRKTAFHAHDLGQARCFRDGPG